MKIVKYTRTIGSLLVIAGVLFTIACKKYLDVPPQGQLTEDEIKKDPSAAGRLVNGVYNVLWLGDFGPDIHGLQYVILTNIASDDADKGSTPQDYADAAQIDNFTVTPNNSNINNAWQGYFQGVVRANQALDKIPLSPLTGPVKASLEAEVRFLRAYFYFNLVRFFGGVPILDHVLSPQEALTDKYQTRASRDSVYNFIISDLQFAVANLPLKGAIASGHATKGAAEALLAKVYMYKDPAGPTATQNWNQVLTLTNDLIGSGKYSLVKNYALIWRETAVNGDGGNNNSESIFEVQTGINAACNEAIKFYSNSQGPRAGGKGGWADLGFGFGTPSTALANAYEPGDLRKAATIITVDTTGTFKGTTLWDGFRIPSSDSVQGRFYNYKAYHSRTRETYCGSNDYLPKDLIILRLADVLLMHAEASNALGQPAAAIRDLTQIRQRAGLGAPVVTTTLRDAIWHDRRIELALEHDRFFDLNRQDIIVPGTAAAAFAAQGKSFSPKNRLFPIPLVQIQLSNNRLIQNAGY